MNDNGNAWVRGVEVSRSGLMVATTEGVIRAVRGDQRGSGCRNPLIS